jgi:hypothetical protein
MESQAQCNGIEEDRKIEPVFDHHIPEGDQTGRRSEDNKKGKNGERDQSGLFYQKNGQNQKEQEDRDGDPGWIFN